MPFIVEKETICPAQPPEHDAGAQRPQKLGPLIYHYEHDASYGAEHHRYFV